MPSIRVVLKFPNGKVTDMVRHSNLVTHWTSIMGRAPKHNDMVEEHQRAIPTGEDKLDTVWRYDENLESFISEKF